MTVAISKSNLTSNKNSVLFSSNGKANLVRGKTAKALLWLVNAGKSGVTALEISNSWALRLSEYIRQLRHDHHLEIETVRIPNKDGWHGRYILQSKVELISIMSLE